MQQCFVPNCNAYSYSLYCIIKQSSVSMLLNIEDIIKKMFQWEFIMAKTTTLHFKITQACSFLS